MHDFAFDKCKLREDAAALLNPGDAASLYKASLLLKNELDQSNDANTHLALAWTLTEVAKSGVFIDDVLKDSSDARYHLKKAVEIDPDIRGGKSFFQLAHDTIATYLRSKDFVESFKGTDELAQD